MSGFSKKKVEDCFDGSRIFEYTLTCVTITEKWVRSLAVSDELEYYADFPRPFFRIIAENGLQCKGVVGERTFKVIYPKKDYDMCMENFENKLLLTISD